MTDVRTAWNSNSGNNNGLYLATSSTSVVDDIASAIITAANERYKEKRRNVELMEQLYLIPVDKHGEPSKQLPQICVGSITASYNGEYSIDGCATRRFTELLFDSAPLIKKVIFNNPATIVFWADGSKTVVRCQKGDVFSKEVGLAMAYMKKISGNKGNYYNKFKKAIKNSEDWSERED